MIPPSPLVASTQGTPSRFATRITEVGMQKAAGWLKFPKDAQNVRPSHPPTATFPPAQPTDFSAIDFPGRALSKGRRHEAEEAYINDPSKLARASSSEGGPIGLKRARFDAHRPQCKRTIIPVWALGEHKRPTGCPLSLCARCASTGRGRPPLISSEFVVSCSSSNLPDKTNSNAKGWSSMVRLSMSPHEILTKPPGRHCERASSGSACLRSRPPCRCLPTLGGHIVPGRRLTPQQTK